MTTQPTFEPRTQAKDKTMEIQSTQKAAVMPKTVKSWLTSDYFRQQVALVLPKHLKAERFVRVAITALTRVPKLAKCTPESVLKCMMTLSELGLEPDGRRAHLIPFGTECTLIVDYKGLVELAKNSGDVSNIHAQTICENDDFSYDTGEIHHKIDFKRERGAMYAAYSVINFKDGGKHTEVMTKVEIDRIRKRSKAANNGPWVTDYEEMAKKTVFRRASKWVKLSPEVHDALERDADGGNASASLVSEIVANGQDDPPQIEEGATEEPEATIRELNRTEPEKPKEKPADKTASKIETCQEVLAGIVTKAGFSFDEFAKVAEKEEWLKDAASLPGFEAVPNDVARRLARAEKGLIAALSQEREIVP